MSGPARAALAALALLAAVGCGATRRLETVEGPGPGRVHVGELRADFRSDPKDLLTDLADDGSLARGLSSSDAEVRRLAARGLGRLPDAAATAALRARLPLETEPRVLAELAWALGQQGDPFVGDDLTVLLHHESPRVRAAAAAALGRTHDDRHTDLLVAALADDDARVRGQAALALFRLDGRRYEHARSVGESLLNRRDEALAGIALRDPDAGARWRATYTLAHVRGRGGLPTVLRLCLDDDREPFARVFAARGLGALAAEGHGTLDDLRPLVDDPDERVALEAVAALGSVESSLWLAEVGDRHPSVHVRRVALEAVPDALADEEDQGAGDPAATAERLRAVGRDGPSAAVRRAAWGALAAGARDPDALETLARSRDPRDRAEAARLLATGALVSDEVLDRLLDDTEPAVRAAALPALGDVRFRRRTAGLHASLQSDDPAVVTAAAQAAAPHIASGEADPRLLLAAAEALDAATGDEMVEARQALQDALGLPREATTPPPPAADTDLLTRTLARQAQADRDPRPVVWIETAEGTVTVELLRDVAPVHVGSFLELARDGFYDGLDVHRVVPNFVVQGLDPRGDGWGTGGRRLPDEFSDQPYEAFTMGMPNAGEPHTGGCQVFFSLVPTPHLDGHYTVFGRVTDGRDVVARLEVGDRVLAVRQVR